MTREKRLEAREGPAMMSRSAPQQIYIRDLKSIDDFSQLKAVEKETWGVTDEDALPLTVAIALRAAGNVFVGAFDKEKLVGFAFGFFGREHGLTTIHSHMLAVLDACLLYTSTSVSVKLAPRCTNWIAGSVAGCGPRSGNNGSAAGFGFGSCAKGTSALTSRLRPPAVPMVPGD